MSRDAARVWTTALLVALAGCAQVPALEPGEQPAPDSDEAGLWMRVERAEENLRTSGRIVHDPAVNDYVSELVCELAGEHCAGIRVYVVRLPYFNASMRPNGTLEVWTGLLLRAQNEAQLAYVLAHEIAHYRERHTLERWRRAKNTANALVLVDALVSPGLSELAVRGSVLAFSRGQEREADRLGFARLTRAGYDPAEAARLWRGILEEREAGEEDEPWVFFSTHPSTESRIQTLDELAAQYPARERAVRENRLLEATASIRAACVRDELRLHQPERSEIVLRRLEEAGVEPAELTYYRAELYRLRNEEGDMERAVESYRAAVEAGAAPAEAHRALGLLLRSRGETEEAHRHLERYLEEQPEASDRLMIRSYLEESP